jgi:hypothetical protein
MIHPLNAIDKEHSCHARKGYYVCTLKKGHKVKHHAHTLYGEKRGYCCLVWETKIRVLGETK